MDHSLWRPSGTAVLLPLFQRFLVLCVDVLDVLPDSALRYVEVFTALPEYVGRVESRHRLYSVQVIPLATVSGDLEVPVYDCFGGGTAEAEYDLGLYRLQLPLQVGVTGFDLTCPRLAVLHTASFLYGRPTFDDVRQIYILSGKVHRGEDVVEELAGTPHKRQTRCVLVLSRSLANEHQGRVWISGPEDRVRAVEREIASRAYGDLPGKLRKPLLPVFASFQRIKKAVQNSSGLSSAYIYILPPYH